MTVSSALLVFDAQETMFDEADLAYDANKLLKQIRVTVEAARGGRRSAEYWLLTVGPNEVDAGPGRAEYRGLEKRGL